MIVQHGRLGVAHFSRCRRYRYLLTRGEPSAAHLVTFVMLNPSTADADANDRTIARCTGFATRFAVERGWTAHRVAIAPERRHAQGEIHALLRRAGVPLHRLGPATRSGAPSHLLYLPGTIALEPFG